MGVKRSIIYFLGFILICVGPITLATNPADVSAINKLYVALGSPPLPGWTASAGDPCIEGWQGVSCDTTKTNILSINVISANLVGELGDSLGSFTSLQSIDLSNNRIGGSIPTEFPVTITSIFLADNNFTGTIPITLSALTQLSALSLNDNNLSGEIPDSFEGLTSLVNLDLSSNDLSGELPSSLQSLSSLTTFYVQNNQLSGTLDVLQDLPLSNLNVENNLFNGPIPEKLLAIPNFRKDGNQFNTTSTSPSSPPASGTPLTPAGPGTPFFPSPRQTPGGKQQPPPGRQADGPSSSAQGSKSNKSWTAKKKVWVSIASIFGFIVLGLVCLLFTPQCFRRRKRINKRHEIAPYNRESHMMENGPLPQPISDKAPPKVAAPPTPKEEKQQLLSPPPPPPPRRPPLKPQPDPTTNVHRFTALSKQDSQEIDFSRFDIDSLRPPPPPPPPPPVLSTQPIQLPFEKVIVEPMAATTATATATAATSARTSTKPVVPQTSVRSYTIAALQQYTNSFSQDNLIGGGMLGSVYRAQLPDGKFLAVKKLDKKVISQQKEEDFIELVNNIDKIRHANVVEIMGYCSEHGQRLLIYEYCSSGTLQDALHSDDEYKRKFSWKARIRMALGAARALEYLHEFCEPPVIHRNFKSANVLLDDDLSVRVSDCGLAPLITPGSVSQLSGQLSAFGYSAPEFESGIYTSMSDVYSFGVVMLELLTGRMSYDSARHRGEQLLVRWAVGQLHDIDALSRMVDPSLNGQYPPKSLSNFADIISRCVQAEPEFRPPMSEVVQDLINMIRRESSGE